MTIRITKEFNFDMAHALDFHDGKCKNIHGHSYQLLITVKGLPNNTPKASDNGMIMDFGDLKKIVKSNIVDSFDHALVLENNSPFLKNDSILKNTKLILVDYQPTSENLIIHFVKILQPLLPNNVRLAKVFLRETATSYAEWLEGDN